jgi:hypothetical protein
MQMFQQRESPRIAVAGSQLAVLQRPPAAYMDQQQQQRQEMLMKLGNGAQITLLIQVRHTLYLSQFVGIHFVVHVHQHSDPIR